MADSQGRKVGIVDEVAARPEGPEEFSHHFGMPQSRWGWCDVGPRGPCRDDVTGLVGRQRLCKDAGVGADANERHQAQPWKSNGLTRREGIVQPVPRFAVMPGRFVNRVQENVRINELHFPMSRFRTSSSSSRLPAN